MIRFAHLVMLLALSSTGVAYGDFVLNADPRTDMGNFTGQISVTTNANGQVRWGYLSGDDIVTGLSIVTPPLVTNGAVTLSSGIIDGPQDAAFINDGANDAFDLFFDTNQLATPITLTGTGSPFAITFPTPAARTDFYAKATANTTLLLSSGQGSNPNMSVRLNAIPEPSPFLYLGLCCVGLICRRRFSHGASCQATHVYDQG